MKKDHYCRIVTLFDSDAEVPLKILDEKGMEAAINYLSEWDYGGESENCNSVNKEPSWGITDCTYNHKISHEDCEDVDYILIVNNSLGYIGLVRMVEPLE